MAKAKSRNDGEKADTSAKGAPEVEEPTVFIPLPLQQHVLNVFRSACVTPAGDNIQPTIQEVKQHLFNRDFAKAFGSESYLWAYAARWSPSRALAYLQIFQDVSAFVTEVHQPKVSDVEEISRLSLSDSESSINPASGRPFRPMFGPVLPTPAALVSNAEDESGSLPPAYGDEATVPAYENPPAYGSNVDLVPEDLKSEANFRITCLGGGAGAELVAAAAWLRLQSEGWDASDQCTGAAPVEPGSLEVYCIDSAAWDPIVTRLDEVVKTPPDISKYASAATKASNLAMLPADAMKSVPIKQDLLDPANLDSLRALCLGSNMITMMFTLNELYSVSVSKTQRLLFEITVASRPGTLLLVVDSPGSYSTVTLNGTEKKYPMQWLLDHTLLTLAKNTGVLPRGDHWEKVLTDGSRWFRLPQGLDYPIELENMRYQIHLYRRREVGSTPQAPTSRRPG